MTRLHIIMIISLCMHLSCTAKKHTNNNSVASAEEYYLTATQMMHNMQYDSALLFLNRSLESGFTHPMNLVKDTSFYALIDYAEYRPEVRSLLKKYSIENHASMVRDSESGNRIQVTGIVLDESDNKSVENALVELVQADRAGRYFEESSVFNPRLFAYLRTDEMGGFSINTIRPGMYPDEEGNVSPAHIHFTIEKNGYRTYGSEFTFEDDFIFVAEGNEDGIPVAKRIPKNDPPHYEVVILMQRE